MTRRYVAAAVLGLALLGVALGQGGNDGLDTRWAPGKHIVLAQRGDSLDLAALASTPTPARVVSVVRRSSVPNVQAFLAGYDAAGGNPAWRTRFVEVVRPCEFSRGWTWRWGDSWHLSVMQFHPDTWATAAAHTGLGDPENLHHVGANTAWWSNEAGPEPPGGWACW